MDPDAGVSSGTHKTIAKTKKKRVRTLYYTDYPVVVFGGS